MALTRRTLLRKALLGPWDELVWQIWLYALADAQRCTQVAVHQTQLMVNHHHTSVTPSEENLPVFTHRLHTDVSKALNLLLEKRGYDAPGSIFDKRQTHQMRLLDASAQASHLLYEHLNPVAAGLVSETRHMPGWTFSFDLWKKGGVVVKKPPIYFGRSRPKELLLELTPPPLLMEAFSCNLDKLIYHMTKLSEVGSAKLRAQHPWPALGAQKLERLHPWSEPRTPGQRGQGAPHYKIGVEGNTGRDLRKKAREERIDWLDEHERCRQDRLDGQDPSFPHGTYGMRVYHNAPVEPPPTDALLAQPGPLLDEVLAAARPPTDTDRAARDSMLDALRDTMRAPTKSERIDFDFDDPPPSSSREDTGSPAPDDDHPADDDATDDDAPPVRPDPEVVTPSAPRALRDPHRHPRRQITLRGKRRRPKKKKRKRGPKTPS